MKKYYGYIINFLILFVSFFFQSSPLMENFEVASVTPNLIFVLLFIYSIYLADKEVITYAIIFGSLFDLLFMKIYGVTTVLLIGFSILWLFLRKYIYSENKFIVSVFTMVYTVVYEGLWLLINMAIWNGASLGIDAVKIIFAKAIYNGVIALFVFMLAKKLREKQQEVHR